VGEELLDGTSFTAGNPGGGSFRTRCQTLVRL
jgi:hypothetical protein